VIFNETTQNSAYQLKNESPKKGIFTFYDKKERLKRPGTKNIHLFLNPIE